MDISSKNISERKNSISGKIKRLRVYCHWANPIVLYQSSFKYNRIVEMNIMV
jgi:hypothetical protein